MATQWALAARAIRADLKKAFPAIKFSVTSESYSMGNSVNISKPADVSRDAVQAIVGKYQRGSFNGMIDSYEYDNKRSDIPQVMFVQIQNQWVGN